MNVTNPRKMQCLAKSNISVLFSANKVCLGMFVGYLLSTTREFGQQV